MSHLTPIENAAGQPSTNEPSVLTNMTSGIELECLAYTPRHIDPKKHVADALCRPVLSRCSKCSGSHSWKLPFVDLLDRENLAQGSSYAGWQITYDMSVRPDKDELSHVPEGSSFFSMEIVSRVINFTRPTPCPLGQRYPCTGESFEWDAQTEIFSVIQRVREAFSGPGYCLANNKNTGLHIHYGNGKERPPIPTSLGMFGVFAVLERLFDNMLTCSRIPLSPFKGHPDCGIHRSSAVYKYDHGMVENRWIGSLSSVFLQILRSAFDATASGRLGQPHEQRTIMNGILIQANAPKMLDDISWYDDNIEAFVHSHPNIHGDELRHSRYMAINLTNLYTEDYGPPSPKDMKNKDKKYLKKKKEDDSETGTVEVRLNAGTMDPSEVWASYDFMGKIMLWLSTPGIDHNTVILGMWADANCTLLDLVKLVGASQTTFDYYTDRLSHDWAVRRHSRLTSSIDPNDPFKAFKLAIENNCLKDSYYKAVDAKI
ncbi:hypothetical protein E4T52_16834 [Aureobasidium sp. EXF-3400]|jgi:hypothetical protein|nr:hypothetical protein E4T51_16119 [Aureobasidium sp. EXF-12344]KAI4768060.1 hypothetical protein E4T52_16834 [Aureobasidium sp. EXF-3400]